MNLCLLYCVILNIVNGGSFIMAQKLKDESRQAIIQSAKEEFLEKGYKNASMRNIAKKANMTVGNLYRYFQSKEDINRMIVGETLKEINDIIRNITSDSVSMETRVFNIKADVNELSDVMNQLADRLVDVYQKHKIEFNILMMNSGVNKELIEWFSKAINSLIDQHFPIEGFSNEKTILSRSYAISIFAGMREIFRRTTIEKDQLKVLVKTYLNSYIVMLDSDIRKLVK